MESRGSVRQGLADGTLSIHDLVAEYETLRDIVDCLPVGIQVYRPDEAGRMVLADANWMADRILGTTHAARIGQPIEETFPGVAEPSLVAEVKAVASHGATLRADTIVHDRDQIRLSLELHAFCTASGSVILAFVDVTERDRKEQSLRKLSQAVEQSPAVVIIADADGVIEYVNPRFTDVTGYTADEVVGTEWYSLDSGFASGPVPETLRDALHSGSEWRGELFSTKKNQQPYWEFASISPIKEPDGAIKHYVAVKEDITLRKEYEQRLLRQANYDVLTGLPNRLLTMDRIEQAILRGKREGSFAALGFIDLDDFKNINDTLGHAAGDELIIEAALRIKDVLRSSDTVGRLGGDEFLVVLPDLKIGRHATLVAEKVLEVLAKPFTVFGQEIFITASIGLTVYPDDGDDAEVLLRNADTAMYKAKESGKNMLRFYSAEMNESAMRRLKIETELRRALQLQEVFVVFQPVIGMRSNRLVGAEALIRWENRELGPVLPDAFIAIAEQTGMIESLGEFVMDAAARACAAWCREINEELRIAVNVSSRQLRSTRFADMVERVVTAAAIRPEQLEIEITERVLVEDNEDTLETIARLSRLGTRLSIDDFGTGYSSLGYLRRFPVNSLKVDRSFVNGIPADAGNAALTRAIISMAHGMGLEVIAEGVETSDQWDFLRATGSDLAQGFFVARPMPGDTFLAFARRWHANEGRLLRRSVVEPFSAARSQA